MIDLSRSRVFAVKNLASAFCFPDSNIIAVKLIDVSGEEVFLILPDLIAQDIRINIDKILVLRPFLCSRELSDRCSSEDDLDHMARYPLPAERIDDAR